MYFTTFVVFFISSTGLTIARKQSYPQDHLGLKIFVCSDSFYETLLITIWTPGQLALVGFISSLSQSDGLTISMFS